MLIPFFLKLRQAKVPVTLREFLDLLGGMEAGLADFDVEAFYFLARTALVKDPSYSLARQMLQQLEAQG